MNAIAFVAGTATMLLSNVEAMPQEAGTSLTAMSEFAQSLVATSGLGWDAFARQVVGSNVSCMKDSGYSNSLIVRGYTVVSGDIWNPTRGEVNKFACTSLNSALRGGIQNRDIVFVPCPICSESAASQLSSMLSFLNANCPASWSGKIWLTVGSPWSWMSSTTSNRNWY